MNTPSTLLAGLLFAAAAGGLALVGLLNLDAFSAMPFRQSFMLPHLMFAEMVRDPVLRDRHLAWTVPALLGTHAVIVLLAVGLAAIVILRAKDQPWASRLALGLGGASFYVAHFCFVHPGGPLTAVNLSVRALDYVAVVALAIGVSNLLHFFLLFPRKCHAGEMNAFARRDLEQRRAKLAASKWPWRRWEARPARIKAADKALASRLRMWQWTQSTSYLVTIVAVGWLLLTLLPVASPMGGTAASTALVLCVIAGYGAFGLGMLPAVYASSVLEWHLREGEPAVRWGAAVISRSVLAAIWILLGSTMAAFALVLIARNMVGVGLIIAAFPVGVPLVALVSLVSVGIATWRATAIPSASANPISTS